MRMFTFAFLKRARQYSLVVAFVLAAGPMQARAQTANMTLRDPVIANFGWCVSRLWPGRALDLLGTRVGSEQEVRAALRLVRPWPCLQGRRGLTMRTGEVRGTVAEAMLERNHGWVARLRSREARPAIAAPVAEGRLFVAGYAQCLAEADPANGIRLLETPHQSPEESAAIRGFGETLSACMPEGYRYTVDPFDVRNHVAARLYDMGRESRHAGQGAR